MKKLDWKNLLGAAFFVAAILVSGVGRAVEKDAFDSNQNALCNCARIGFNTPECEIVKNDTFPALPQSSSGTHNANTAKTTQIPANK